MQDLAVACAERLAVGGGPRGVKPLGSGPGLCVDASHQSWQRWEPLPGPLIHPRLDPDLDFFVAHSAALTGHGATHGAHRAGSSAAHRAMS